MILSNEISADASNVVVVITSGESVKVLNIFDLGPEDITFDVANEENAEKVKDKIAPSIAKDDKDGYKITVADDKTITIEFTEAIKDGDLCNRTFEVKDNKITGITSIDGSTNKDSKTVIITLETAVTAGDVSITQKLPVYDMSGNKYTLDKTVTVTAVEGD